MRSRFALLCFFTIGIGSLLAQAPAPTPDENPEGNTGALKAQVMTGGSYDANSGNATRMVNDLHVPGALGVYGLDFTRYWNSLHNEDTNPDADWPTDFGMSGWSHSWRWGAIYGEELPDGENGGPARIWTTSITINFPDGHATKFKITRTNAGVGWHDPRCGPPYLAEHSETSWPTPGHTTHDHLSNMTPNGSEFWLERADGGAVHFIGVTPQHQNGSYAWWFYEAREVFDPHGLRTDLSYEDGNLTKVEQEGNRWLTLTWKSLSGWALPVIGEVKTGGDAGSQHVTYNYRRSGGFYTLATVGYVDDPAPGPGQIASAIYTHGFSYGNVVGVGPQSYFPLLKTANDPHYAGSMTRIGYNYFGDYCRPLDHQPDPPPSNFYDWHYFTAEAIAEERSSETGIIVARFEAACQTGLRKD